MDPQRLKQFEKPLEAPNFPKFSLIPSNLISLQIAMSVENLSPEKRKLYFQFHNQTIVSNYLLHLYYFVSVIFFGTAMQTLHVLEISNYILTLCLFYLTATFIMIFFSFLSRRKFFSHFFVFILLVTPFLKYTTFDLIVNFFSIFIFIFLHLPSDPIKTKNSLFRGIQIAAYFLFVSFWFQLTFKFKLYSMIFHFIIFRLFSFCFSDQIDSDYSPFILFGIYHLLIHSFAFEKESKKLEW